MDRVEIYVTQARLGYNAAVGSLRFGGVLFIVFSNDHLPCHVHGFASETEVIVDLRVGKTVALANRDDAIRPANAKRSDVRKILNTTAEHFEELTALWETIHGKA